VRQPAASAIVAGFGKSSYASFGSEQAAGYGGAATAGVFPIWLARRRIWLSDFFTGEKSTVVQQLQDLDLPGEIQLAKMGSRQNREFFEKATTGNKRELSGNCCEVTRNRIPRTRETTNLQRKTTINSEFDHRLK
jgi:hypothetical protein